MAMPMARGVRAFEHETKGLLIVFGIDGDAPLSEQNGRWVLEFSFGRLVQNPSASSTSTPGAVRTGRNRVFAARAQAIDGTVKQNNYQHVDCHQ